MVIGVNHIGMAVKSIDETMALWKEAFGATVVKEKKAFPGGQTSCLIEIQGQRFELMEPNGEGTIKKYLEKHGEGLHHISLKVSKWDEDLDRFESEGLSVIRSPEMRSGFIKPKGNFGLLCEVSEGDV